MKKYLPTILALCVLLCASALAEAPVAILFTSDVHCAISESIGYADLAAYENAYADAGYDTLLVDCGDAITGDIIGAISKGEYIIQIMNEVGYDVATLGNHEFDYGAARTAELIDMANFPYVCANFLGADGNTVFEPYRLTECGGRTIAFVGVTISQTLTQIDNAALTDADGNAAYSFCFEDGGTRLYDAVQRAVDSAVADGADVVVVLSHLGSTDAFSPYSSRDLIANTTGIDAVLDGHSHSVIECERVMNKDGEAVVLSSLGMKFENIGALTVKTDEATGETVVATELFNESIGKDARVADFIDDINAQYTQTLEEVVICSDFDLRITDFAVEQLLVRICETNLGDLCADAYRVMLGADIGLLNGGSIRSDIEAGEITCGDLIKVLPFGDSMCVVEATGAQILDALEMGARELPGLSGGFLQVSGLTFEIDMNVESSVVVDKNESFVKVAGERRVRNVMVDGEPIDTERTYTVASTVYLLQEGGSGMSMFKNAVLIENVPTTDYQTLIDYVTELPDGNIGEEYADIYGQGRITILQ